jgi:hypothetical protein
MLHTSVELRLMNGADKEKVKTENALRNACQWLVMFSSSS